MEDIHNYRNKHDCFTKLDLKSLSFIPNNSDNVLIFFSENKINRTMLYCEIPIAALNMAVV